MGWWRRALTSNQLTCGIASPRRLLIFFLLTYLLLLLLLHSFGTLTWEGEVDVQDVGEESPPHHHLPQSSPSQPLDTPASHRPPQAPSCPPHTPLAFIHLTPEVILYSAFYDDRVKSGSPTIRLMSILQKDVKKRKDLKMWCSFSGSPADSPVTLYEMCENHNKRFGGYYLSCEAPPATSSPCNVRITVHRDGKNNNATTTLPILYARRMPRKYTFLTCVPPLHSHVSPDKVVEFIEMARVLGGEHFVFYIHDDKSIAQPADRDKNRVLHNLLHHYQQLGLVTVLPWSLSIRRGEIWYYGQSVAIGDCLYRNMGRSEYVTFNDLDEYIVPRIVKVLAPGQPAPTWADLATKLWPSNNDKSEKISGYRIQSAFFNPRPLQTGEIQVLDARERSSRLSKVRTKTIVRPSLIFEVGIHHISRPLDGYESALADPNLAILHHYRKCIADFGMICTKTESDDTMLRYKEKFIRHYNTTLPLIDNFIKYGSSR